MIKYDEIITRTTCFDIVEHHDYKLLYIKNKV